MKASDHGEHLVKLTRQGWCNAYLVREDDGLTLVDTMLPRSQGAIFAAAKDAGGEIRRVVLTHAHGDHAGSLLAMAKYLPEAEIVVGRREARLLSGDKSPEPGEPAAKPRSIVKVDVTPTRLVDPGDRIGSLEVHAAPGHTPGQIALLDTRDGTLIAADSFSTLGGVAVTSKPNPKFPFPALASWHKPTALATAQALRALDPARLAVGHGRVVEQPGAEMDAAIAKAGG